MSEMGLTAEEVGEKMHDWQAESIGYIANFQDEWKKAIKQGKTFEEFMQDQEKDLKDTSKATGKYTKEDKKLYQALKKVIDLNIDRVDAEQAFDASANGSQIYRNALENLMNALGYTIDDSGLMIDMLVANSIVHGDVADATNSASDAYNQFSQEIATAIENVSKLNTVLTESVSGAGISTQNIDAFKEMFGDDYVYALERSANGYHINAEKLQTLIDKQNALTNSDYQKTLDAQYDALKRCNDEIIKANNEQKDTSGLLAQRQGILQRIQDTQDLMMAYQASTSAFQTWTNAQSNGNEYDMYNKIANGYDTVKDLIDRGWSGDDTVRSYLDLIYGESFDAFTASGEECAEMFDNLDKKIEDTSFSIHDFFQFDESGKLTSNGIFNFFDALEQKQEKLGLSESEKWIKTTPDAFCNTNDKEVLAQVLNDYDQETNDFYRWTVEYTADELSQLVNDKLKDDFGIITDLIPLERGKSGRIWKLKIVGTKKTFTIGKELEIRRALSETHLYSSAFDVEKTEKGFRLNGKGWGHGVGLCQIGAAVMGQQGYRYDEILLHYYRNAEIKKIY